MLIEEASGKTLADIEAEEGRDAVVIAEASVIEQLAVMLRCSIGTMGGGWGATARHALPPRPQQDLRPRHWSCHMRQPLD